MEASARASRVEVYQCKDCGERTRFPRYGDPVKLLETRTVRKCSFIGTFSGGLLDCHLGKDYIPGVSNSWVAAIGVYPNLCHVTDVCTVFCSPYVWYKG